MRGKGYIDHWRPLHSQNGFTILELIIALILVGVLSAIFGMGLVGAVQSFESSRTNTHIAQKAQLAMTRMSRELMELTEIIAVSGGGNDSFIIYERLEQGKTTAMTRFGIHHHRDATDSAIRIYTSLDKNTTRLDGSTISNGDILIDGVDNFALNLYLGKEIWESLPALPDIQLLSTIEMNMALARPDKPGTAQGFEARIHLRNNNNFGGAAPTTTPASSSDYNCFIHTLIRDHAL